MENKQQMRTNIFQVSKEDKKRFYRNVNMDTIQYIRVNGLTHTL